MNIEQQIEMSYNDFVNHLIRKYGSVPYDYFCNENCASEQRKNSRNIDGLVIHHIDECQIPNLSNRTTALKYSFEHQQCCRLVYCNLIEHFLLHIKIVQEFNNLNSNVGFGGLAYISTQINTYFIYPPTRSEWQINLYNVIKDSYNDYLILLKQAIYTINTCKNNNTFKPMELFALNFDGPVVNSRNILNDVKALGVNSSQLYPYIGDKVEIANREGVDIGYIIAIVLRDPNDDFPSLVVRFNSNKITSIPSWCSNLINVKEKVQLNNHQEIYYPGDYVKINRKDGKIIAIEQLNDYCLITVLFKNGKRLFYLNDLKHPVTNKNTIVKKLQQPKTQLQQKFDINTKVKHKTFGTGIVVSVKPLGNDYIYEIDFGNGNIKKLMGSYANLKNME